MQDDAFRNISRLSLKRAVETLCDAEAALSADRFSNAASRAYYVVFHAMQAALALDHEEYRKHSAVISFFTKSYVRTGVFDARFAKAVQKLSSLRNMSDYDIYTDASPDEAAEAVQLAREFLDVVKRYVENRIDNVIE